MVHPQVHHRCTTRLTNATCKYTNKKRTCRCNAREQMQQTEVNLQRRCANSKSKMERTCKRNAQTAKMEANLQVRHAKNKKRNENELASAARKEQQRKQSCKCSLQT